MMSMRFSFFTRLSRRHPVATREKKYSVGVLFVVCTLHEVANKNLAATLETEDDVDTLFVLHEVVKKTRGGNMRKEI